MGTVRVSFSAPKAQIVGKNVRDCCIRSEALIRQAVRDGHGITIEAVAATDRDSATKVVDYLGDLNLELMADQTLRQMGRVGAGRLWSIH